MADFNSTTIRHVAGSADDAADAVWEMLAQRIDALVAAWEQAAAPPALEQFVPDGMPNIRRLALCELAKIDMEYRRDRGHAWRVEDYLKQFPELQADGRAPSDLIYEEYHLRRKGGEPVAAAEYLARFPNQADELRRLMD